MMREMVVDFGMAVVGVGIVAQDHCPVLVVGEVVMVA
jgi:hypothetical protein